MLLNFSLFSFVSVHVILAMATELKINKRNNLFCLFLQCNAGESNPGPYSCYILPLRYVPYQENNDFFFPYTSNIDC